MSMPSERTVEAPRPRAHAPLLPRVGAGFAVAGRGFFVFDEDPREAASWGRELHDVAERLRRRARLEAHPDRRP